MERRKFVIGLGSLAAGGAAATGTGAFTSAEVDRQVTVDVEDDVQGYLSPQPADTANGDAYARLQGPENEATNTNDDVLIIQFNGIQNNLQSDQNNTAIEGSSSDYGGGLNKNAVYEFDDLITVTNQGPQTIDVSVDGENGTGANPAKIRGLSAGSDPDPTLNEADNFGGPVVEVAPQSNNTLAPGESVRLNFAIATSNDPNSNYSGSVIIKGDAN
ncbi:hypothetical protein [Halorubrum sp. CBA1229]|uniref:hypothetical protein n=1 Tax=Halorubrum sp. CBA1229 TaxID=1853699 RepID=UPI0011CE66BF|nr:hypothetical protein [Halorubrum sp. CBA1229]QKY17070.1 hypothetical protein Hrr1229_009315 [Halorubrum sp. CBA1229]